MPTYAILGATGNIGTQVLKVLLNQKDANIHALARTPSKLEKLVPEAKNNSKVEVFQGSITDLDTLTSCIKDTNAVFMCVAENSNKPGCSIAQDTSRSVLAALDRIKQQNPKIAQLPRLIVLSSASLEEHLSTDLSPFFHNLLRWYAIDHVYNDLEAAEKMLRKAHDDDERIKAVFFKPGGIAPLPAVGHELTTERSMTFVTFADCAGAMVEVAENGEGKWDGQSVSVLAKKGVQVPVTFYPFFLKGLALGLLFHVFPWLYPYIMG